MGDTELFSMEGKRKIILFEVKNFCKRVIDTAFGKINSCYRISYFYTKATHW